MQAGTSAVAVNIQRLVEAAPYCSAAIVTVAARGEEHLKGPHLPFKVGGMPTGLQDACKGCLQQTSLCSKWREVKDRSSPHPAVCRPGLLERWLRQGREVEEFRKLACPFGPDRSQRVQVRLSCTTSNQSWWRIHPVHWQLHVFAMGAFCLGCRARLRAQSPSPAAGQQPLQLQGAQT